MGEVGTGARSSEILLIGLTGFGLLLNLQQNVPTLQVKPTYLASGTGTSQCWSGLAQPHDLGSTTAIRFFIFWTFIPAGNLTLAKSKQRAWASTSRQGIVLRIIVGRLVVDR